MSIETSHATKSAPVIVTQDAKTTQKPSAIKPAQGSPAYNTPLIKVTESKMTLPILLPRTTCSPSAPIPGARPVQSPKSPQLARLPTRPQALKQPSRT
jgi:hypothetical protein